MLVVLAVVVAAFPLGILRGPLARALSASLGRPVVIGGLERVDSFSFEPVVRLTGVRVAQPDWAGRGDMAVVDSVRLRFAALSLLRGKLVPIDLDIDGLKLELVRDGNGRTNWEGDEKAGDDRAASTPPQLRHLRIAGSSLHLADAKRHVVLSASIAADAAHGVVITGSGTLRGQPVQMQVVAGKLDQIDPAAPYPFRVALQSDLVRLDGSGTMDHVLDTGHFTATVRSSGKDLKYLDDVIQAGVPATQDYALVARVRHENPDWIVTGLGGTIGQSDLAGSLTVRKRDGRSVLDGRIASNRFNFDDLSSDEQQARAAAEEKRTGKRILPNTAIHFEKLARTDGVIHFDARKLVMKGKSPFVGLHATLTMDHRLLTVKPVEATLVHGTLGGVLVVDHRSGDPKLTVTLDLNGGRIEDIFTEAKYATAPLDGRIRLHGTGRSVREALGRGDGTIGLVSRGGAMRLSVATLGAGDVVRGARIALSKDRDAMTPIRCVIGRFTARGGQVTAGDLVLDTEVMRAGGSGTVDLGTEGIALTLAGRSKNPDIIQSTVPIHVGGTLALPTFDVVPVDRSPPKKSLLGRIGEVIKSLKTRGDAGRAEAVPDAPCDALAAAALR
ncbi:AsmA family protein [Sphingosinicellaceae bacterium]|nr:AsmA family protein [Sphingosinicellaceae bacterium]